MRGGLNDSTPILINFFETLMKIINNYFFVKSYSLLVHFLLTIKLKK